MEYINSCGELREGWDRHDLSVHAGWLGSVRGRVSGHEGSVAFLMKDFVLFAASLYLLKQDVARVSQGVEQGDVAAASKSVEAMR